MFAEVNGFNIHYIEAGQGPDVLLLHGWGASTDSWRGVIEALSHSCHLVAIDFPGCGKSSMPDRPLTTDDYMALVMEFCNVVNFRNPILIGHSHGCRVIMKLCGVGLMTPPKIVFIDGAGLKPKFNFKKSVKQCTFKTIRRVLTLPGLKSHTEGLLNKARGYFGSADYSSAPEVMRKTMVNLVNDDMTPYIDGIKAPTLLIWGENDTETPLYMAQIMEAQIPDCKKIVYKSRTHYAFLEESARTLAIANTFLN